VIGQLTSCTFSARSSPSFLTSGGTEMWSVGKGFGAQSYSSDSESGSRPSGCSGTLPNSHVTPTAAPVRLMSYPSAKMLYNQAGQNQGGGGTWNGGTKDMVTWVFSDFGEHVLPA
jgi:hypothetical protein